MYYSYYDLNRNPFDLTPDPGVVFMSESHQEALAILRYGVLERKGFLLLTGDVGTGKTTLLQLLLKSLDSQVHYCLINNPALSVDDFYDTLAAGYGFPPYTGKKSRFLRKFSSFLAERGHWGEKVVLIIDEAHVLPVDLLEDIRLLSNQQGKASGILSVFLVGQPELNQRLSDPRLLPLRQRIAIRFHLEAFDREATANYIGFRLRQAGALRFDLFTPEALDLIHKATGGVPRLINILCDQALLTGFAENKPVIKADTVRDCVRDLHIPGETEQLPLPPQPGFWALYGRRAGVGLAAGLVLLLLFYGAILVWQNGYYLQAGELIHFARRLIASLFSL
jgi:general secretion pathway protein A